MKQLSSRKIFFSAYWATNSGDWLTNAALGWFVSHEINAGSEGLAYTRAAFAISVVLSTILAGSLAGRFRARKVYLVASLILGLCSLCLAYLSWSSAQSLILVVFLRIICGLSYSCRETSEQMLMKLIPDSRDDSAAITGDRLLIANTAWKRTLYYLNRFACGGLAGVVLSYFGSAFLFGYDAATFLFMVFVLVFLFRRGFAENQEIVKQRIFSSLKECLAKGEVRLILALGLIIEGIGFNSWNLLPEIVGQFGGGGFAYGAIIGATGFGGLTAAFFAYLGARRLKNFKRSIGWFYVISITLCAVSLTQIGLSKSLIQLAVWYSLALVGWSGFDLVNRYVLSKLHFSNWSISVYTLTISGLGPLLQLSTTLLLKRMGLSPFEIILVGSLMAFGLLLSLFLFAQEDIKSLRTNLKV